MKGIHMMYFEVTLPQDNMTHIIKFNVANESDVMILYPMFKSYITQAPWIEGKASKIALVFEPPILGTHADEGPKTA